MITVNDLTDELIDSICENFYEKVLDRKQSRRRGWKELPENDFKRCTRYDMRYSIEKSLKNG